MRRTISLFILIALFVAPALAATIGDPIDGNDRTLMTVDEACGRARGHDLYTRQAAFLEGFYMGGDYDEHGRLRGGDLPRRSLSEPPFAPRA